MPNRHGNFLQPILAILLPLLAATSASAAEKARVFPQITADEGGGSAARIHIAAAPEEVRLRLDALAPEDRTEMILESVRVSLNGEPIGVAGSTAIAADGRAWVLLDVASIPAKELRSLQRSMQHRARRDKSVRLALIHAGGWRLTDSGHLVENAKQLLADAQNQLDATSAGESDPLSEVPQSIAGGESVHEADLPRVDSVAAVIEEAIRQDAEPSITLVMSDLPARDGHDNCLKPAAMGRFVYLIANRGLDFTLFDYGEELGFFSQVAELAGGVRLGASENRIEDALATSDEEAWALRLDPSATVPFHRPVPLQVVSTIPGLIFRAPRFLWPLPVDARPPSGAELVKAANSRFRREYLHQAGLEIDALAAAREVVAASPFTLDDRIRVAELLEGLDFDYSDQIIADLTPVRALFPDDWRIPFQLARSWQRKGEPEEAIREYLTALRLGGSRPEIHLPLARLYSSLDQPEEAVREYDRLKGSSADSSQTRLECAQIHFNLGRWAAAEADSAKAVELDARNIKAHELLVNSRLQLEDSDGVVAAAMSLLALDPDNAVGDAGAGLGLAWQDRFSQALPHLERSVERSPEDFDLRYQLFRVQRGLGKIDQALESLIAATALRPADPELYLARADLQGEKGDFLAIGEVLQAGAAATGGEDSELQYRFGRWLERRGRHGPAADAYRKAAANQEDSQGRVETLQRAAVETLLAGRPVDEAMALFKAAGVGQAEDTVTAFVARSDLNTEQGRIRPLPVPGGLQALLYFAPFLQKRQSAKQDLLDLLFQFILEVESPRTQNERRLELLTYCEEHARFKAWLKRKKLFAEKLSLHITTDPSDLKRANRVISYFGAKLKRDRKSPSGLRVDIDNDDDHRRRRVVLRLMGLNLALLRAGSDFGFSFPNDDLPVLMGLDFWLGVLGKSPPPDRVLLEWLQDPAAMRLYVAFGRLPTSARAFLSNAFEPSELRNDILPGLWAFGNMLKFEPDGRLWLPGGAPARSLWARLADRSPDDPTKFTKEVFKKDDGKALYYLASLSQAPAAAAGYVLSSGERFRRFYGKLSGFRDTRKEGALQRKYHDFADLLWLLEFDGDEVYFPGSPEMWGIAAKGEDESLMKLDRKLRKRPRVDGDKLIARLIDQENSGESLEGAQRYAVLMHLDKEIPGLITPRTGLAMQWSFARFGGQFGLFADLQTEPGLAIKILKAAENLEENVSNDNRRTALTLFQAPLALLQTLTRNRALEAGTARQLVDDFLSAGYPAAPVGRQALAVHRFFDSRVFPAIGARGAAEQSPDPLVEALAGRAEVAFSWSGREVKTSLQPVERRRINEFLRLQNLSPLPALFQALSALERLDREPESAYAELAQACARLREPEARDWTNDYREGIVQTRLRKLQEKLAKLQRELQKRKSGRIGDLSADIADELAPFLADSLLGLIYAANTHEDDLVSRIDGNFVRKHYFAELASVIGPGGPQPFGGSWGQPVVSHDPILGSRVKGGLVGIDAVLTQFRAEQLKGGLTNRIAEPVFAVQQKLAVDLINPHLLGDATLTQVASMIRLAEVLVAAATADPLIRRHCEDFVFTSCGPKRSEAFRGFLASGEVRRAREALLPSELLFLARSWLEGGQESSQPGWWFFQSSPDLQSLEGDLAGGQAGQLGFPAMSWHGANALSLEGRMPPEASTTCVSPHRLAERMAELKLRLTQIFWRNGLPASIFRPVADRLADEVITSAAQAGPQDWQALWEAIQTVVNEENVLGKVNDLIPIWSGEGS